MMGNDFDFKFVMQNFSEVYFGLRFTYKELAEGEDTPQRLKAALYQYVLPEVGEDIRICDHILTIEESSRTYMVFSQLKGKIKVMVPVEITDRKGRTRTEYREKILTVEQLVKDPQLKQDLNPEYMLEYRFSKLHLGSLAI